MILVEMDSVANRWLRQQTLPGVTFKIKPKIGSITFVLILAQALRLCTGRTANRGSRGMALLFLDHATRRR